MSGKKTLVGRPQKYNEQTKIIAFRIPISETENVRDLMSKYLITLEK